MTLVPEFSPEQQAADHARLQRLEERVTLLPGQWRTRAVELDTQCESPEWYGTLRECAEELEIAINAEQP